MGKIVVLGGSFNPPTRAHEHILSDGIRQTGARLGIFVPSSEAYVSRKMGKKQEAPLIYTEEQRRQMLELMCRGKDYLTVNTCEYGDDGRGHTLETLQCIQEQYPEDQILFLMGSDKLKILPRWKSLDLFFPAFQIGVCCEHSKEDQVRQFVQADPVLSKYQDFFQWISIISEEIRSTNVRKAVLEQDDTALYSLCNAAVVQYLKQIEKEKRLL